MALTEARKASIYKYKAEKIDRLGVDIPKGKRAAYREVANELGMSMSQLVQAAVEEFAKTHAGGFSFKPISPAENWEDILLIEDFHKLPKTLRMYVAGIVSALVNGVGNEKED